MSRGYLAAAACMLEMEVDLFGSSLDKSSLVHQKPCSGVLLLLLRIRKAHQIQPSDMAADGSFDLAFVANTEYPNDTTLTYHLHLLYHFAIRTNTRGRDGSRGCIYGVLQWHASIQPRVV